MGEKKLNFLPSFIFYPIPFSFFDNKYRELRPVF